MADKEEQSCPSCSKNTNYTCLRCQEYLYFGETVKGWKRADHSHIVSHVKEEVTEEHEKVQCNNSIESGKPRRGGGGVVLRISSDRDARRIFLGSKVWISGRKIFGKYLFG